MKAISIKISQGAKPGLGGLLPGAKVNAEVAEARGVAVGETIVSPPSHNAFDTPLGLIDFIDQLRELSGGKPVGFKLCIGSRREFLAICKAMIERNSCPDFIIVDGSEGGTGAGPVEFEDNVGMPLTEGLMFVHNALVGSGLRDQVKIGASGKVASGIDIVKRICQGADFTLAARAMMFAVGCIQAQKCHTNHCPVGVTTQDPWRTRALDVERQEAARLPVPGQDREQRDADRRVDGPGLLRPADAAQAVPPRRPAGHQDVPRPVPLAGRPASCWTPRG